MGALNAMMLACEEAINKLGQNPKENDGYEFKVDTSTRSVDDVTIRAGDHEFVLAIVWKNLPGWEPCCPNLGHAFRDNYGWSVIDTKKLKHLKKIEKKYKALKRELNDRSK